MTEIIKKSIKNAPEKVKTLFKNLIEDKRLAYIESYLMYGDSVLYSEFKVKEEVYFNEERYFSQGDIIQFEVSIDEAYENEFPIFVTKIGKIEGSSYVTEINLEKAQLE